MYDDLTAALTAAIIGSALGATFANRVFPAEEVPPASPFPRCYIAYRRGPPYRYFPKADGGVDRTVSFEVKFATTTQDTPQAAHQIQVWDKAARAVVQSVVVPGMASLLRTGDLPPVPQSDERKTYIVGGGAYDALFQEN